MNGGDRQFLLVLLVALAVVLSGCAGGGNATPTDGEVADAGDGGDDGGSDGSSGDTTPTDGAEVDETATQTATSTSTPTSTPTPNASGPTATDEPVGPLLADLIRSADKFRYRIETSTEEGPYVQVGRWYEDDFYASIESLGDTEQSYEVYSVDGRIDTVIGGRCVDMDSQQVQDPENTSQADYDMSVRPIGTDSIDGEEVYIYEVETGESPGTATYYVDTGSGYVRKVEFMDTTFEYWDFGSAEPVESPC